MTYSLIPSLTLLNLPPSQVSNDFQANKEPTIGAAFLTQKCRLEDRVLRYEIWDTAGQERFHSLAVSATPFPQLVYSNTLSPQPMYYRNAQAAVVVYDVTKASSLEKAKTWVKELQRQANPTIVIALAGNKIDLVQPSQSASTTGSTSESEDEPDDATATPGETAASDPEAENLRQVPREEAQAYAEEAGLLFFETSAKTGEGVVDVFTEIGTSPSSTFLYSLSLAVQQRIFLSNTFLLHHAVQLADQVLPEIVPVLRKVSILTRIKRRPGMDVIVKALSPNLLISLLFYNTTVVIRLILYICCTPFLSRYL